MGKSNKFDFSNRPSSGVKLGSSIGQTLEREARKHRKDGNKHSSTSNSEGGRKRRTDSARGDKDIVHYIDLQAPYKQLSDEGFCMVTVGLEACLNEDQDATSFGLEDLNVAGNGLTSHALAQLVPVITLSRYTLKTVNLADNAIHIHTDEQAKEFETFLRTFQSCQKLRRLDLSGNALGSKAFELLAKVHGDEDDIYPWRIDRHPSVLSLGSITSNGDMDPSEADEADHELATARILPRRCGLRSIPYLNLRNTGLDDAGALWLSYVVETHHFPSQLLDGLNAVTFDSTVRSYQQDVQSTGIEWDENSSTLGKEGCALLKKAETVRESRMLSSDDKISHIEASTGGLHLSDGILSDEVVCLSQDCKRGTRHAYNTDDSDHELSELESIRRKVQRHIIEHCGYRSAEIWCAAFEAFWTARKIRYIMPPSLNFGVNAAELPVHHHVRSSAGQPPASTSVEQVIYQKLANSQSVISDEIWIAHRQTQTPKAEGLSVAEGHIDDPAKRYLHYQEALTAQRGRFRNANGHVCMQNCRLESILDRVISFALTKRQLGALSDAQRIHAAAWGQSKETLATEEQWNRHAESLKVWLLLDSIRSLSYEMNAQKH